MRIKAKRILARLDALVEQANTNCKGRTFHMVERFTRCQLYGAVDVVQGWLEHTGIEFYLGTLIIENRADLIVHQVGILIIVQHRLTVLASIGIELPTTNHITGRFARHGIAKHGKSTVNRLHHQVDGITPPLASHADGIEIDRSTATLTVENLIDSQSAIIIPLIHQ